MFDYEILNTIFHNFFKNSKFLFRFVKKILLSSLSVPATPIQSCHPQAQSRILLQYEHLSCKKGFGLGIFFLSVLFEREEIEDFWDTLLEYPSHFSCHFRRNLCSSKLLIMLWYYFEQMNLNKNTVLTGKFSFKSKVPWNKFLEKSIERRKKKYFASI